MKRSKMLKLISTLLDSGFDCDIETRADNLLCHLEQAGMQPPPVKALLIKGEKFPWGEGCTMRCSCDECDRDFLMNRWEKEPKQESIEKEKK
jgi:hypothetical protein